MFFSLIKWKVITTCEIAKDVWDKFRIKNEGNKSVKKTRLRRLIIDLKNLTKLDFEYIAYFQVKIYDISNDSYILGEEYSSVKLVHKVLGSLAKRLPQ